MKEERIIELVNGTIDGTNTPSDQTELAGLLGNPSVKDLVDEMQTLDRLLAAVPLVDPPSTLKSGVMHVIAGKEAALQPTSQGTLLDRILAPFMQRPARAVAYAFAMGLVVGVAVLSLVQLPGPDSSAVQGTIGSVEVQPLADAQIVAGASTADIVVNRLDSELRVDIDLVAAEAVMLALNPDSEGTIVIESGAGTPTYSVLLPATSTLRVILTAGEASEEIVLTLRDVNE